MRESIRLLLVPPRDPLAWDAYGRVAELLACGAVEAWVLVRGTTGPAGPWPVVGSLEELGADQDALELCLCWDGTVLGELWNGTRLPVIYGVTVSTVAQGVLPVHGRIVGYLGDGPLARVTVLSCGIPLERLFTLAAWVAGAEDSASDSGRRDRVLLVSDEAALSEAVAAACGTLGKGLDRVPQAGPAELYARYRWVVACGTEALRAAAAGAAVVVADGRGCAGALTRDKLPRILEAQAGPACFELPVGPPAFLAALTDPRASAEAAELARDLRQGHSKTARARQLLLWLREMDWCARAEAGTALTPRWPQWVSLPAMAAATNTHRTAPTQGRTPPTVEALVEGYPPAPEAPPPRLPLNQYLAAGGEALAGFFGTGWSFAENWGRWTDGDAATVQFEPEAAEGELELLLHIHAFLPPGRAFQRVIVSVNGRRLLCWKLDRGAQGAPFRLPLRRDDAPLVRIEFQLPDADTPGSWSGKRDFRRLGLGLVGLKLQRAME